MIAVVIILKRIKPWGFRGLSLYQVSRFFIEGLQKGAITTRAAAIAFRLFLAFFPLLIVLLSLIPYIPVENFQENLFNQIRDFFPGDTFQLVESTLDDLINKTHSTVLSIGFVLVLYYASNSINALLIGFNGSYHLDQKGNALIMRVFSFILLLILGILIVVAIVLIMFSGKGIAYLKEAEILPDGGIVFLLNLARWIISVALVYFSITMLFNVGETGRKKWKWFTAGAAFSTALFILGSLAFAWFVSNMAQFNKLYGSIGTLIVFLIWIDFNAFILLLGFDLNTSIKRARVDYLRHQNNNT
jgi:membrane protein